MANPNCSADGLEWTERVVAVPRGVGTHEEEAHTVRYRGTSQSFQRQSFCVRIEFIQCAHLHNHEARMPGKAALVQQRP